jgi:hypothetical protein
VDFLSAWVAEDIVRDLGYVNDLTYCYKMDDNDMKEVGKPLTNDFDIADLLNIFEVYHISSGVAEVIVEVPMLPSPGLHPNRLNDDDDNNGHGDDTQNVEGDVGHKDEIPIVEGVVGHEDDIPNVDTCMSLRNEAPSVVNSNRVRKSSSICKSSRGSTDVEGAEVAARNCA